MMCSRVVVIHKGRIRASDTPENLLQKHRSTGEVRLELHNAPEDATTKLSSLGGVKDVQMKKSQTDSFFLLRTEAEADPTTELLRLAGDQRWDVRGLVRKKPTLEDVFVDLTQGE